MKRIVKFYLENGESIQVTINDDRVFNEIVDFYKNKESVIEIQSALKQEEITFIDLINTIGMRADKYEEGHKQKVASRKKLYE